MNVLEKHRHEAPSLSAPEIAQRLLLGHGAVANTLGVLPKTETDAIIRDKSGKQLDNEARKAAERLLKAPTNPEQLAGNVSPDVAIVFGSDGIYMKEYFETVSEWLKDGTYKPKQVVVLSGMCPAIRELDIAYCDEEQIDPSGLSEADLAAHMIRKTLRGELISVTPADDEPEQEALNELGRRSWAKQTFVTPEGLEIILTNGRAVPRALGFSRPTTESTLRDACDMSLFKPGQTIHGITRPPHGLRMMHELIEQLTYSGIDSAETACLEIGVSPGVGAADVAILYNKMEQSRAAVSYVERLKLTLASTEIGQFDELFDKIHKKALQAFEQIRLLSDDQSEGIAALDMIEQIKHVIGAPTEARRDAKIPEFKDMESLDAFKALARELGIDEKRDIGIDEVVSPNEGYTFISEGGTAVKMTEQLKLLKRTTHNPTAVILSGAKFRTELKHYEIPALNDYLGTYIEEVGSEYEIQEILGKSLVTSAADKDLRFTYDLKTKTVRESLNGEESDFTLLGYDENNAPIVVVEYRKSTEARLNPAGLIEVVAEFMRTFETQEKQDNAVVMASAALYSPSHIAELMKARVALKEKGINTKTALAAYGVIDENGPGTGQLTSEINSILLFMAHWRQKTMSKEA